MLNIFRKKIDFEASLYNGKAEVDTFSIEEFIDLIINVKINGPLAGRAFPKGVNFIGSPRFTAVVLDVPESDEFRTYKVEVERRDIIHLLWWILSKKIELDSGLKINKQSEQQKQLIVDVAANLSDIFFELYDSVGNRFRNVHCKSIKYVEPWKKTLIRDVLHISYKNVCRAEKVRQAIFETIIELELNEADYKKVLRGIEKVPTVYPSGDARTYYVSALVTTILCDDWEDDEKLIPAREIANKMGLDPEYVVDDYRDFLMEEHGFLGISGTTEVYDDHTVSSIRYRDELFGR